VLIDQQFDLKPLVKQIHENLWHSILCHVCKASLFIAGIFLVLVVEAWLLEKKDHGTSIGLI